MLSHPAHRCLLSGWRARCSATVAAPFPGASARVHIGCSAAHRSGVHTARSVPGGVHTALSQYRTREGMCSCLMSFRCVLFLCVCPWSFPCLDQSISSVSLGLENSNCQGYKLHARAAFCGACGMIGEKTPHRRGRLNVSSGWHQSRGPVEGTRALTPTAPTDLDKTGY